MELGLTWPLQRYLRESPDYGMPVPDAFCWDLHRIILRGKDCLLLVHSLTRYTCLRFDLPSGEWGDLFSTVRDEMETGLLEAGLSTAEREAYFLEAGSFVKTRTHGRRLVAYLNRAWEDVLLAEPLLNPETGHQTLLCQMVNNGKSRSAAYSEPGRPADFLLDCIGQRNRRKQDGLEGIVR